MKNLLTTLAALTLILALGACGSAPNSESGESGESEAPAGFSLVSYDTGAGLHPRLYVYEHIETKTKYIIARTGYGLAITPLVTK